jgi:alkylhydroperoxidase family enzyme
MTPAARVAPLAGDAPQLEEPALRDLVAFVGYRPNALLTMAKLPNLLQAVLSMVHAALRQGGELTVAARFLIACESSRSSGCYYSTVHAVHAANHAGVAWEKLAALPHYASSPQFDEAERAALAIASAAGRVPVTSTTADFQRARRWFSERQLLEIVAAASLFGWFNRWNGLMQSELEPSPAQALAHVPWLASLKAPTQRNLSLGGEND